MNAAAGGGSRRGARALLLDRDGVINVDHGYIGTIERFELVDGVPELARRAAEQGWRIVVITNQSGIARGYFTEDDFVRLTAWMAGLFAAWGAPLTAVMHCPYHRDGTVAACARDSYWRKPNPGMIMEAARRYRLDLPRSLFIGDTAGDMAAARAAGVGGRLLLGDEKTPPCADALARIPRLSNALPWLTGTPGAG